MLYLSKEWIETCKSWGTAQWMPLVLGLLWDIPPSEGMFSILTLVCSLWADIWWCEACEW